MLDVVQYIVFSIGANQHEDINPDAQMVYKCTLSNHSDFWSLQMHHLHILKCSTGNSNALCCARPIQLDGVLR